MGQGLSLCSPSRPDACAISSAWRSPQCDLPKAPRAQFPQKSCLRIDSASALRYLVWQGARFLDPQTFSTSGFGNICRSLGFPGAKRAFSPAIPNHLNTFAVSDRWTAPILALPGAWHATS